MLSRPEYRDEEICELKTIIIDFPTRTANELRTEQLQDLELKKTIDYFENPNKGVDFANWTGRGYVMNQGVLYRYSPHDDRKWGVIDPQTELTLFENNIQWVPVVRYLGLHIDSRLTYKKHIDYLSDKFWGRITLAISLFGRSSPLSLENKVILYKQTLRPILTYGSSIWAAAAPTHKKRIQIIQNKILRIITNAPWLIPVAVNSKQNNSYAATSHMDIIYRQTSELGIASQDIGDICAP
ncbi:RNA-directed DNA polymerase from mobile element jockey [Trichonephila clavipes]|nr:RNA-directed DNA polymerase from mobile element jockey [Trichonephila clavipes]